MQQTLLSLGAAMALCLGATGVARADIIFNFSASGTGNNVLFGNGVTVNAGVTLIGTTNQTSTNVEFIGNGRRASPDHRRRQNLSSIDISLQQANSGFTSLVFNLNGLPGQTGNAIIIATDQFGIPQVELARRRGSLR